MKGAHYHCPVNGWDCPYYKDSEIIEGSEEYCLWILTTIVTIFIACGKAIAQKIIPTMWMKIKNLHPN